MSDTLFPQNPDGLFPENPSNPTGSSDGGTTPPVTTGGAYPVYIRIPKPSIDSPLTFKQGDTGRLVVMLEHQNGSPMDLTGKAVTFKMQSIGGGALKIDAPAVVESAAYGIVYYDFTGDDTDTAGNFKAEFLAINADETIGALTYPADDYLHIRIRPSAL